MLSESVRLHERPTEQYDKVTARFDPLRTDDVKHPEQIGKVIEWQAVWIIEDGQFEGQWAWQALDSHWLDAWAPAEDLVADESL